jgi:hypothetical protein
MELEPKSSFFIRTFNVINATILGKIGTLNCPNRFTNNRSLCYVVAICVLEHRNFDSNGFSLKKKPTTMSPQEIFID